MMCVYVLNILCGGWRCICFFIFSFFKQRISIRMVQEAQNVRSWLLNSRKISVPDDWLEACIEWIHSESEVTSALETSVVWYLRYLGKYHMIPNVTISVSPRSRCIAVPRYREKCRKYREMTISSSLNHSSVGNNCTLQCGNKVTVKQAFANCSVYTALVSSDDNVCLQSPLLTVCWMSRRVLYVGTGVTKHRTGCGPRNGYIWVLKQDCLRRIFSQCAIGHSAE